LRRNEKLPPFPTFPHGEGVKKKEKMAYSRIINESKHNHGANLNIRAKAKDLRGNMTHTEKKLWNKLRKRQLKGMHFRRQHPYGIYILDFYCFEANLAIEVDGGIHLFREEYDEERNRYLESSGIRVLRFTNQEIETIIDSVIDVINKFLESDP